MQAASPLEILRQRIEPVIASLTGEPVDRVQSHLRPAGEAKFGDYQCNAAMPLAKSLGQKPVDVARRILAEANLDDIAQRVEIAGPGFINIHLRDDVLTRLLAVVPGAGVAEGSIPAGESPRFNPKDRLGIQPTPDPQTVVIDYSSPNVAKQMHVGHLRSTIIGDALARVLELAGHRVIRQNHLGDWGTAIGAVITGLWYIDTRRKRGESLDTVRQRLEEATALKGKSVEERRLWLTPIAAEWTRDFASNAEASEPPARPASDARRATLDELELGYVFIQTLASIAQGTGVRVGEGEQARELEEIPRVTTAFLQRGDAWERAVWQQARAISIDACQELYARLRVTLEPRDVFGESAYEQFLPSVVQDLETRLREDAGASPVVDGLRTIFKLDQGARCLFIEKQTRDGSFEAAFKTADGAALPMIIQKSDGAYLYSTTDLAAIRYRVRDLGASRLIYAVGSPQKLHFQMLFAAARCAGYAPPGVSLEHVTFGSVLGENKRPLKTREGGNVKLRDLLDEAERRAREVLDARESGLHAGEAPASQGVAGTMLSEAEKDQIAQRVGIAAIKYFDLARERNNDYVFNWDQMLAFQGNTAPYLMYAYARVQSIYRKAAEAQVDALPAESAPIRLGEPAERALALRLVRFREALDVVANELTPHVMCTYLYELASDFMRFYESCPVLAADDAATRRSRMQLCELTARTLKLGLAVLGIEVLERM